MTNNPFTHPRDTTTELAEIFQLIRDEAEVRELLRTTTNPQIKKGLRRLVSVLQAWRKSYCINHGAGV